LRRAAAARSAAIVDDHLLCPARAQAERNLPRREIVAASRLSRNDAHGFRRIRLRERGGTGKHRCDSEEN
jgi:hypothetical protein